MTDDMLHADPRLRRLTVFALMVGGLLALIAMVLFQRWLNSIGGTPGTDLMILRLRGMIGIALTASAVCLALLAGYAAHKASSIKAVEQWPLPGTRVIRDTPIRRGEAAHRIERQLNIVAVTVLVLAFATGAVSWQMFN